MAAASVSRARLLSTRQLLDDAVEQLDAGLPLPGADQAGAADLVENGRRALLQRAVGDVPLEALDRGEFPPSVVTQLARVVCGRDDGGVGQVKGRQLAHQGAPARPPQGAPSPAVAFSNRVADGQERPTRRVAVVQGGMVVAGEQERWTLEVVRPPARHVEQPILPQVREHAQALRHPAQLAVLLPLHVDAGTPSAAAVTLLRNVVAAS